jgi:hypothetical protein
MAGKSNNLFAGAKTVADDTPKKKGVKKEVFIKELDVYTAIDTMIKTLEGVKDIYRKPVIDAMETEFVNDTLLCQERPENFKGKGLSSEASCEMKKRSSKSPLSVTELAILAQHKVETEKLIVSPARTESFMMSPDVMEALNSHPDLANDLSAAMMKVLGKVPDLKGKDIILRVPAKEEESVQVIKDSSFDDAAKILNKDDLKQVLGIIGTLSIKPKMTDDKLETVLNLIGKTGMKLSNEEPKKKSKK